MCRHSRGQGRKNSERRKQHHITGDLEHDLGDLLGQLQHRRGPILDRRNRRADKNRENHNLQDLIIGHGLNDRFGHQVGNKVLERQGARIDRAGCRDLWQGQAKANARGQQVHHNQANRQRDNRGPDKPGHGLGPDPANGGRILHMGNANH